MRLIDADLFKSKFRADTVTGTTIHRMIDEQQTAYDADKVVEKITELQLRVQDKSYNVEDEEYAVMLRGQLRGIADCLEIVKSSGVVDD